MCVCAEQAQSQKAGTAVAGRLHSGNERSNGRSGLETGGCGESWSAAGSQGLRQGGYSALELHRDRSHALFVELVSYTSPHNHWSLVGGVPAAFIVTAAPQSLTANHLEDMMNMHMQSEVRQEL